jgi:hypothetical protein
MRYGSILILLVAARLAGCERQDPTLPDHRARRSRSRFRDSSALDPEVGASRYFAVISAQI